MPRLNYLVMCLILASLGGIRATEAQTTAGSILGEVSDSSGAKLPGVAVTARSPRGPRRGRGATTFPARAGLNLHSRHISPSYV